jgi:hypothetical protein
LMLRKRKDGMVEDRCDRCGAIQSVGDTPGRAIALTTDLLGLDFRDRGVLTCPDCRDKLREERDEAAEVDQRDFAGDEEG